MSLFNFKHPVSGLALAVGALVAGAGVFAGGCGGGYGDEASFCQALAQADCSQPVVVACFGSSDATLDNDTNRCISARSLGSACNPKGLPYHSDGADACIQAHQMVFSSTQITKDQLVQIDQACVAVFNRGGQVGQRCSSDEDCDVGGGLACISTPSGAASCQTRLPQEQQIQPGMECGRSPQDQCTDGFHCDGHCVSAPSAGERCGAGVACDTDSLCGSRDGEQVCIALKRDGQSCEADSECSGFCAIPIGGRTGVCQATMPLQSTATACSSFR